MRISEKEKWEKMKAGGKKQFIIRRGVIGWGLTLGIISPFINAYLKYLFGDPIGFDYLISKAFLISLIFSLIFFPIGGWFFGLVLWNSGEKRYNKQTLDK